MARNTEIKVLSAVEQQATQKLVDSGATGKDVVDSLEVSFKSLLWGLELKRAQKRIVALESKSRLNQNDFDQLELLKKSLSTGKTIVTDEVGQIFEKVKTGHLSEAQVLSERFLLTHNEDDLLGVDVLSIRELGSLKTISKEVLTTASKVRNRSAIDVKDGLELVKLRERTGKVGEKLFGGSSSAESTLDASIRTLELKRVRTTMRQDYDSLTIAKVKNLPLQKVAKDENAVFTKKVITKDVEDSLKAKNPKRGKELQFSGRELRRRLKELSARRERQAQIDNEGRFVQLSLQWKGNEGARIPPADDPLVRREAGDKLQAWYGILGEDLETLDAARKYYTFDEVDLSQGIVRPNQSSGIYFVDASGARVATAMTLDQESVQDRVMSISEHLEFSPDSVDRDLGRIIDALTAKGAVPSAEAIVASKKIYLNMGRWDELYKPYTESVQNFREEIGKKLKLEAHAKGESFFPAGMMDIKGESFLSPDLVEIDITGAVTLNEKGKKRLELLRGMGYVTKTERNTFTGDMEEVIVSETIEQRLVRAGSYENDQYAAYSYDKLKAHSKVERAKQFGMIRGVQMMFPDIDEDSDPKKVEEAIKKVVFKVFGSDDSSRDQKNFENMTNLVYLVTLPQLDSKFKNLWLANLAVHDVNMMMGGAENGEDMTRLRSFIPKEYWDALLGDDNHFDPLDGRFFDADGNVLKIDIHARDIMDELETQVPGRKNARDVYINEILGATDQRDLSVQWRRFTANTVGKKFGEGIECRVFDDGTFKVVSGEEYIRLADGTKIHYLNLFGLDKEGNMLEPTPGREELFKKIKGYDVFDQFGVFFQQGMTMGHLKDRTVAAEKGGNYQGKTLRYLPNILRKMYGASQKHYYHQKDMAEVPARGQIDSQFRTQYAWHFQKRDIYLHRLDENLQRDLLLAHGGNKAVVSAKMEGFWKVLDRVSYSPEKFHTLEGLSGELRFNSDVRWIANNPGLRMYKEIFDEYSKSGLGADFNWKPVLDRMGIEPRVYRGKSIKGAEGLKIFMENYRIYGLLDIDALPHNEGADWAKYDGKSEAQFNNGIPFCENPQDPNLRLAYAKAIDGYLGNDGREIKLAKITYEGQRRDARSLDGYRTYGQWVSDGKGGKKFEEKSVLWKVPMSGGRVDLSTEEGKHFDKWNRIYQDENGMELILTKEGYVIDENLELQYRPDTIKATEGLLTFGAAKGLGSFTGDRNLKPLTWHERKEEMEKMRRLGGFRRPRFTDENLRFKAQLYFGAEVPVGKKVTLKTIADAVSKKPYLILAWPYTVMRGIIIDMNLDWGDWLAFWEPMGGELKKQGVWV